MGDYTTSMNTIVLEITSVIKPNDLETIIAGVIGVSGGSVLITDMFAAGKGSLTIEKGVPIPPTIKKRLRSFRHIYPFNRMEVGDSILIDATLHGENTFRLAREACRMYGNGHNAKFSSLKLSPTQGRIWRIE